MIKSKTVDEVVLAILADFNGKKPSEIVEIIVKRLQILAHDDDELKDAILFLQNLSDLRKFGKETSKKLKAMPVTLDYKKSTLYKEGIQEGKEMIAFKLYNMGLDLVQISKGTDFTIDYLKKLFKIS